MSISTHTRLGRTNLLSSVGNSHLNIDLLDQIRLGNIVNYSKTVLFTSQTVGANSEVVSAVFDNSKNGQYMLNLYARLASNSGSAGLASQTCILQSSCDGTNYYDINNPINIFVDSTNTPIINEDIYVNKRYLRIVYKNGSSSSRVLSMEAEVVKQGL